MITILRRWPSWALVTALATAPGCGQPPPMVSMAPPGSGVDPLAIDLSDESNRAKALGETPMSARQQDVTDAPSAPLLEPTEPGEEVATESGLTYGTIEPGDPTGPVAMPGDTASVRYRGTLADGTEFDSNMDDRREPFSLVVGPAGGVIEGWKQGIPGMRVGELRRLVIPSELGYGRSGSPPVIPPDAELTFEVKLLSVRKGR